MNYFMSKIMLEKLLEVSLKIPSATIEITEYFDGIQLI